MTFPAWAAGEEPVTIERAAELLASKVVPVYRSWTPDECIRFIAEGQIGDDFDIAIRERHDERCSGDPRTSPVIDRFRVVRKSGEILWFDAAEAGYRPFDAFLSSRRR